MEETQIYHGTPHPGNDPSRPEEQLDFLSAWDPKIAGLFWFLVLTTVNIFSLALRL